MVAFTADTASRSSSGRGSRDSAQTNRGGRDSRDSTHTNHGGHGSRDSSRGRNARGRGRPRAAPITGDASSVYCYRCGYPNHKANNCEAPPSSIAAAQPFTALHLSDQSGSNWYPDTGASHHMTPDSSLPTGFIVKELKTGRILLTGPRHGALYQVSNNKDVRSSPVCFQGQKSNGDVWHARLGHPSSQVLRQLAPCISFLGCKFTAPIQNKPQNKPQNFASLLWFSYDTVWIILKETLEIYRLMAAEILTIEQANCASNAITLLQFIAASSETRPSFLRAKIVYYLFPFLKLTNISKSYEHLRVSSLIVIGALVKSGDPEVLPYLLDMESFPLVFHCLQIGGFLSKVIASFIIRKIASDKVGLHYCCHPAERFYFISKTFRRIFDNILDDLENILERLAHDTLLKLFRNIIFCYLKWSECPRARDALSLCLPTRFTAPVVAHMFQVSSPDEVAWSDIVFTSYKERKSESRSHIIIRQKFLISMYRIVGYNKQCST
ncbi:hypothetical protein Droror1_Dr00022851 [Drosera rotundifolia]